MYQDIERSAKLYCVGFIDNECKIPSQDLLEQVLSRRTNHTIKCILDEPARHYFWVGWIISYSPLNSQWEIGDSNFVGENVFDLEKNIATLIENKDVWLTFFAVNNGYEFTEKTAYKLKSLKVL